MGWFGKKKIAGENPGGDALYVDMEANEGLPVAVAVPADDDQHSRPPPTAPQTVASLSPKSVVPADQSSSAPPPPIIMDKRQALQQCQANRRGVGAASAANTPRIVIASRTPAVIPICPHCGNRNVRTRIRTAPDVWTWLAVIALAFVFWPLCWIPLVTDVSRHTHHYCGNCNAEVGNIHSFQDCCVKHR